MSPVPPGPYEPAVEKLGFSGLHTEMYPLLLVTLMRPLTITRNATPAGMVIPVDWSAVPPASIQKAGRPPEPVVLLAWTPIEVVPTVTVRLAALGCRKDGATMSSRVHDPTETPASAMEYHRQRFKMERT